MKKDTDLFDPISLEIFWTRLISIVDEAAKTIVRTAFSTLSNEANDFACVLTDSRGNSLAQNSSSIPSFIATLPATVRHFLAEYSRDDIHPGDVFITNNPWLATGHLNDITVIMPIFRGDNLVAFAATTAHVPDIGGKVRSVVPREVFEEGFHIPLMKLMRRGEPDASLLQLLGANVRTPTQTTGDVWAQVSALTLMNRRLGQLLDDWALDDLTPAADELFSRTEKAMRGAIAKLPDGDYPYSFQTDGLEEPFTFKVTVKVRGDSIECDFTGTAPVQPRAINTVLAYTYAMSAYAVKCALLPHQPNNEGMFRPVTITVPENCCLNPKFPAAVGGRVNTGHYVPILVFGALQEICPDTVMAGPGSPLWNLTQTGVDANGRPYATVLFFNGGMGATADSDGESTQCWPSNLSSTPMEIVERNSQFLIHYRRLAPDSGGNGKFRGGLGQEVLLESRSESPISVTFLAERIKFGAPGFNGGSDGSTGSVMINGKSVDNREQHFLKKGDTVLVRTPGGGGYGPAKERAPEAVELDRALGYVSGG
jgi:N-methylhydantoinase B